MGLVAVDHTSTGAARATPARGLASRMQWAGSMTRVVAHAPRFLRRLPPLFLSLLVACDSPASTDLDAASADAASADASPDAAGVPAFPCGPTLTTAWTRCDGNAIVRPGRRFAAPLPGAYWCPPR